MILHLLAKSQYDLIMLGKELAVLVIIAYMLPCPPP